MKKNIVIANWKMNPQSAQEARRLFDTITKGIRRVKKTDVVIAGPGDLFSTVLPVLIVPQIKRVLKKLKARKIYIVNIANKPFETSGFKVSDYLYTIKKHLGGDIFDTILVNTNQKPKMPSHLNYKYVIYDKDNLNDYRKNIVTGDFISRDYPLYHDSYKVAKTINNFIFAR